MLYLYIITYRPGVYGLWPEMKSYYYIIIYTGMDN